MSAPRAAGWPGSIVGNPSALVAWAVASGRLAAEDSATALAELTGPGALAYADALVGEVRTPYLRLGGT